MNPSDFFATDRFAGAFADPARRSSSPGVPSYGASPGSENDASPATSPRNNDGLTGNTYSNATSPPQNNISGSSSGLNPRSCVTCRRRKVKCDKRNPCSNCVKQHIECVFPRPGRAPRKPKKPQDAELLARLRRLEGVVQKLGRSDVLEGATAAVGSPPENDRRSSSATDVNSASAADLRSASVVDIPDEPPSLSNPADNPRFKGQNITTSGGRLKIEKEMGKLVVGEGKSRYVSNTFWASLTDEVAEMRDLIDSSVDSDDDDDDDASTAMSPDSHESRQTARQTHQEFIFGYSSTMQNLRILHPPSKQVMTYWDIYVENVDPMLRILHKPTARHLFAMVARNQSDLSKSTEALVFAVYFAAVTSLSPERCLRQLGVERDTALRRYRFAAEQAMARAGFLACQELVMVQAFTLFLVCARRHDENKVIWTLTGLLNRMAIGIGLHRDGSIFNLSPFQTEMRRRLWWQVCTLDVRASEDQGAEPMVVSTVFDTRMPSNVNDEDIWADMKDPPVEHEKCTEMTFDLIRYEIGGTIRLLSAAEGGAALPESQQYASLEAKDALLEKLRLRLEDKYLRHCDMSIPQQWVAANVARLIMAKIWLVIHHPFRKPNHGSKISQETRDRTFLTSIDVIRYSRMLWTQHRTSNWGWLFRTYFQFHAVAFLLSELCVRTTGEAVDEAWEVLTEALPDWEQEGNAQKKSLLWKPIQKLIAKARRVRLEELARRRIFPADGTLGVSPHWQQPPPKPSPKRSYSSAPQHSPSDHSLLSASGSGGAATGVSTVGTTPESNLLAISMDSPARTVAALQAGIGQLAAHMPMASQADGSAMQVDSAMAKPRLPDTQMQPAQPTQPTQPAQQAQQLDATMAMWMDDPFCMENDTWDANQTPWDNVGLDPSLAFAGSDGIPMDFGQSLWSESGLGGTGF